MSLPLTAVSAASGALGRWSLIPDALRAGLLPGLSAMVLGLVQLLVLFITSGVVTLAVARAVAGRPTSTGAIWRLALGRIRPAITVSLALLLPCFGWGMLIAAPALAIQSALRDGHPALAKAIGFGGLTCYFLFISVRYCSVYGVAMVERMGGFAGVDTAVGLQEKRMWLVAGAVLPIEIARHALQELVERLPAVGGSVGGDVITWLLFPIETAAAVLLYVRLRAARDGLSQQALNERLSS
jgi:hypothetical protein